MTSAVTPQTDFVLYDGECPVCSRFVAWSRLRDIRPNMRMIDARQAPDLVQQFRKDGIEINDTMVVKLGDLTLHGADAFTMVTKLSEPRTGVTTSLLKWLASSRLSGPAYPLMVAGRKLLLLLLRRGLIN